MISPENVHISNIMLTEKVTFRNTYIHIWLYVNVCANQNVYVYVHTNACSNNCWGKAVNWKDGERDVGGFRGWKEKGETM